MNMHIPVDIFACLVLLLKLHDISHLMGTIWSIRCGYMDHQKAQMGDTNENDPVVWSVCEH